MAISEFTHCADAQASGSFEFRLRTAQFGDGYTQTAGDGINNKKQNWPLTFTKVKSEADEIIRFFDEHEGHKAFAWKPPLSGLKLFTVPSYSCQPLGAGIYRITATFEEVFYS